MAMRRFDPRQAQRGPQIRINQRIRVPEVRVIGKDGEMLGVLQTQEALRRAQEQGLDLVEVNPKAEPPVCKILDFGKFKYDEKKKATEAKRKQSVVEIKEIKLRPKTDDHDLEFKTRAASRFLEAGHKVKFTVRFRGREITHPEKAQEQLDWIVQQCEATANVEVRPAMEQRTMTLLMAPKPAVMQKVAQARAAAEKARQKAIHEGRAVDKKTHEEQEQEAIEKIEQELEARDGDEDEEDDDDAKAEPKADAKAEAKAEPKADAKAEAKAEPKADAKAEAKAEPKADAKAEAKAEPKADAKAEAKAEPKADAKAEAKAEPKADAKAEAKAEPKVELKP